MFTGKVFSNSELHLHTSNSLNTSVKPGNPPQEEEEESLRIPGKMGALLALLYLLSLIGVLSLFTPLTSNHEAHADKESCRACSDTLEINCPKCEGTGVGKIKCARCKAKGRVDCQGKTCENGLKTCTNCKGRGFKFKKYISVNTGGTHTKRVNCVTCKQTGRVDCKLCKSGDRKCPTCLGKKFFPGECQSCNGEKKIPCKSCRKSRSKNSAKEVPVQGDLVESMISIIHQSKSIIAECDEIQKESDSIQKIHEEHEATIEPFLDEILSLPLPEKPQSSSLRNEYWGVKDVHESLSKKSQNHLKTNQKQEDKLREFKAQIYNLDQVRDKVKEIQETVTQWLDEKKKSEEDTVIQELRPFRAIIRNQKKHHKDIQESLEFLQIRQKSLDKNLLDIKKLKELYVHQSVEYKRKNQQALTEQKSSQKLENESEKSITLKGNLRAHIRRNNFKLLESTASASSKSPQSITYELAPTAKTASLLVEDLNLLMAEIIHLSFEIYPSLQTLKLYLKNSRPFHFELEGEQTKIFYSCTRTEWEAYVDSGLSDASLLVHSNVIGSATEEEEESAAAERNEFAYQLVWGLLGFFSVGLILFIFILKGSGEPAYRRKRSSAA